jgi:hypothetical protein
MTSQVKALHKLTDEYQGQGGSYLLDPKTGIRTLIERTEPATPSAPLPEELSNGSDTQKTDPG